MKFVLVTVFFLAKGLKLWGGTKLNKKEKYSNSKVVLFASLLKLATAKSMFINFMGLV